MAFSKPFIIYADLETESLKANKLLQIAAITEDNNKFSVYINPQEKLTDQCFQITGLYFHDGQLYRNGRLLFSVPIGRALCQFRNWLQSFNKPIHLVFHNAFSFDMKILVKHYLKQNILFPLCVTGVHDTLPIFRKYIKATDISGFKLGLLADHFKVPLLDAHNAEDDALCLKNICEAFLKDKDLSLEDFLNSYLKSPLYFIKKQQKN
jgi:DNA polymerase III alpha subunit (gram-positive type)